MEALRLPIALSVLLFCVVILSFSSSAQVYQWQDQHGVVHFSDKPFTGAIKLKLIELNKQGNNEDGADQLERNRKWFSKYSMQRQRREAAAIKKRRKKSSKLALRGAERCQKLKHKLADVRDKYRAQKRRGISFVLAKQQKMKIELQQKKIKREC